MSLVDGGEPPPERRRKQPAGASEDWIAETLVKPFTDISVKALGAAGDGGVKSLELLQDPQRGLAGSMDVAKLGMQVLGDAAAMLLMPDDSKTRLKGQPGRSK